MTAVQLGVSWLDGQAFSQWWEPLPEAREFHLLSCYVSAAGWAMLKKILDERPALRATLVFSLSGLGRGQDEHFAIEFFDFVSAPERSGRVTGYLIADSGRLFHPKAHASRAAGRTRVVVGSANLTGGGLAGNHEMVSVIDDDRRVYDQFVAAVNRLGETRHAIEVNKTNRTALLRWIERRPIRPTPSSADDLQQPAAEHQLPLGWPPDSLPLLPPAAEQQLINSPVLAGAALANIERLIRLGGRLYQVNLPEYLTVSVSLSGFKRAGIIAGIDRRRLTPGLSMQEHTALGVGLIPDEIRAQLKELNQALGQLTGRFALETAGLPWLPAEWTSAFFRHWEDVVKSRGLALSQIQVPICSHLKQLKSDLQQANTPLLQDLREAVRLQPMSMWDREKAAHLLDYESEAELDRDSASIEQRVLDCILSRVRATVGSRLQQEFVLGQFTNVSLPPRFRSCALEQIDTRDALHVLADWTLAGTGSRVRLDSAGSRAPSNGVAQALHRRFRSGSGEAIEIYKAALGWRQQVSNPQADSAVLLENAWVQFSHWFSMREDKMESWLGTAPSWSGGQSEDSKHAAVEPLGFEYSDDSEAIAPS